jgi:hypothetical protein
LYDSAEDAEWYRTEYRRLGEEIGALKALPERKPGMRMVPTGRTIAQEWDKADDARRRETLTEFEVRVVLYPTGHDPRAAITGMEINPDGLELAGREVKGQLGLDRHGGHVPAGLWARVVQRLLALNAAIWHNWATGATVKRSLTAYDH